MSDTGFKVLRHTGAFSGTEIIARTTHCPGQELERGVAELVQGPALAVRVEGDGGLLEQVLGGG